MVGFAWRFVSPRRGYVKDLRIARKCPEIRYHIDQAAKYKLCERVVLIPILLISTLAFLLSMVVNVGKKYILLIPDYRYRRQKILKEAQSIISPCEIKSRLNQ